MHFSRLANERKGTVIAKLQNTVNLATLKIIINRLHPFERSSQNDCLAEGGIKNVFRKPRPNITVIIQKKLPKLFG